MDIQFVLLYGHIYIYIWPPSLTVPRQRNNVYNALSSAPPLLYTVLFTCMTPEIFFFLLS